MRPITKGVLAAVLLFLAPGLASAAPASKYASIVIDQESGEVLHSRNADAARYPASLTKVMTLYLLFDELKAGRLKLDTKLPVSRRAAAQPPSRLGLKAGQTITVRSAISALITKSANDVAVVVADKIGGNESRFAALMTVKARSLGLSNTTFYNASGLPDARQVSTARDMAELAEAMLRDHADYYHHFSQKSFRWGSATYKNHNKLLGDVEGVDGIKTGYTRASGFNLMASAKRDGRRVIAIMMGGKTSKARNGHVTALLEAAFDNIDQRKNDPARLRMIAANQTRLQSGIVFDLDAIESDHRAFETGAPLIGQGDTESSNR